MLLYNEYEKNILIIGYGNIGKHVAKEFEKEDYEIKDIYIPEYNMSTNKLYKFAFVCVPTDMLEDGSADISAVEDAVANAKAEIFIIKSAVPVGTAELLKNKYKKNIVISPEYYGTTQHSEESPNFLVLGGNKDHCAKVAQLYYMVKNGNFKIRFTDWRTAELAKYMENCFLAMKVTFCNEFAKIGELYGINYEELRECFIMDSRMGDSHTFVYRDTPFYDSHCLNKDIPALIVQGKGEAKLIQAMKDINDRRKVNEK